MNRFLNEGMYPPGFDDSVLDEKPDCPSCQHNKQVIDRIVEVGSRTRGTLDGLKKIHEVDASKLKDAHGFVDDAIGEVCYELQEQIRYCDYRCDPFYDMPDTTIIKENDDD